MRAGWSRRRRTRQSPDAQTQLVAAVQPNELRVLCEPLKRLVGPSADGSVEVTQVAPRSRGDLDAPGREVHSNSWRTSRSCTASPRLYSAHASRAL